MQAQHIAAAKRCTHQEYGPHPRNDTDAVPKWRQTSRYTACPARSCWPPAAARVSTAPTPRAIRLRFVVGVCNRDGMQAVANGEASVARRDDCSLPEPILKLRRSRCQSQLDTLHRLANRLSAGFCRRPKLRQLGRVFQIGLLLDSCCCEPTILYEMTE